jgi:hypothetical protein
MNNLFDEIERKKHSQNKWNVIFKFHVKEGVSHQSKILFNFLFRKCDDFAFSDKKDYGDPFKNFNQQLTSHYAHVIIVGSAWSNLNFCKQNTFVHL